VPESKSLAGPHGDRELWQGRVFHVGLLYASALSDFVYACSRYERMFERAWQRENDPRSHSRSQYSFNREPAASA